MRDRTSVNNVAISTVKVLYTEVGKATFLKLLYQYIYTTFISGGRHGVHN